MCLVIAHVQPYHKTELVIAYCSIKYSKTNPANKQKRRPLVGVEDETMKSLPKVGKTKKTECARLCVVK